MSVLTEQLPALAPAGTHRPPAGEGEHHVQAQACLATGVAEGQRRQPQRAHGQAAEQRRAVDARLVGGWYRANTRFGHGRLGGGERTTLDESVRPSSSA